jgi:hypothetical protein
VTKLRRAYCLAALVNLSSEDEKGRMIERSCLPGSGRVYFSASLSPEALAKAGHVFLMVDLDCAHSWTVNRRSMSPTIFRSARSALDQAPVTNREGEAPNPRDDNFPRKCRTGGPPVDRSVDKSTAFVSVGERTRQGVRAA